MKKQITLATVFCIMLYGASAQNNKINWHIGYIAPYFSNIGGSTGFSFKLKELGKTYKEPKRNNHQLKLLTELGYFSQIKVSHNILFNPELVYKWNKLNKRFFLTSSLGAGYLLSFQKQGGTLNLGTGEIDYQYNALNFFLPTINMGLGVDPKKNIGYYFKATYGRKLSAKHANAGFVGLSTGLIVKFNFKN